MAHHTTTPLYTLGDETHTLYGWGKRLEIPLATLHGRMRQGLPLPQILAVSKICKGCGVTIPRPRAWCTACRQLLTVNMLGHCGTWHPVPTIPHTLPCCGTVLALEGGSLC